MSAETLEMRSNLEDENASARDFLTMTIAGQLFGIQVLQVQDVLGEQKVTKVPLAPPEISGSLNLRGRIVTAINVRKRLGLNDATKEDAAREMSVVVEHDNELYSLIIDKVGDVLSLKSDNFEPNPATLDKLWMGVSSGIYRLDDQLMVILDVSKLLSSVHND